MVHTDSKFYEHSFYGLRKHFIKPRFPYRIIYSMIKTQIFDLILKFSKIDQKSCLIFFQILFSNKMRRKNIFRLISVNFGHFSVFCRGTPITIVKMFKNLYFSDTNFLADFNG